MQESLTKSEILNRLYGMQSKQCSEYTQEENEFIYKCIINKDTDVRKTARDTASMGIWQYITKEAEKMVRARGFTNSLSPQAIQDIISEGLLEFSKKLDDYVPLYGSTISTFTTPFFKEKMEKQLDYEIKGSEYTDNERRAQKFVAAGEGELKRRGIDEPTVQDYYNLAQEGNYNKRYQNPKSIKKAMEDKDRYKRRSIEAMEENGVLAQDNFNLQKEVEQKNDIDNLYKAINKLSYFDRIAIESKIRAENGEKLENKDKHHKSPGKSDVEKRAHQIFKEETELEDISLRDFKRLLTDATNELSKRISLRTRKKTGFKMNDNSLKLDESFDSLFGSEITIGTDKESIDITLSVEFNKKYPPHI